MRGILGVAALLAAAGCASVEDRLASRLQSPSAELRECAQWFAALDEQVEAAGVRDAQEARVAGFPHLRVDRLLASLRDEAASRPQALAALAERMRILDYDARRHEIDNLPGSALAHAPGGDAPAHARRRTETCGVRLVAADLADARAREALLAAAQVPDDYSILARALGLYPLIRLPFASGVRRWQEETAAMFAAGPAAGPARVRFSPPARPTLPRDAVAELLARGKDDPLGQPLLSEREFELLAATYAPSFEVAIGGDYDRFGALRWRRGAAAPVVEASEPVVYVRPAHTRYRGRILLQIAYTIWFPERPAESAFDLLAGRLDGLVWRVTLAPDGEPLLYDSIHPCGCYHQFFPTPRARALPAPEPLEEWAFAPQALGRASEGARPVVSVASGTHYIERVELARGGESLVRYAFRPYDELRSLQRMEGGRRSAFGPDGLVAGSERGERWLYWPMGIASPGAMRQWGRQATAFVGRRHFDDADLIERRFALELAGDGR